MRTKDEVQRAHDILTGIILGEVPLIFSKTEIKEMIIAATVLCWILEHNHNPTFENNMEALEARLADRGFILSNRSN